jgi:hypothetical protein
MLVFGLNTDQERFLGNYGMEKRRENFEQHEVKLKKSFVVADSGEFIQKNHFMKYHKRMEISSTISANDTSVNPA